jgi:Bacterial SH3 domain
MSIKDQNPPASGGQGSDEPTLIVNHSGGAAPASELPTLPVEPGQPTPSSSDATVAGKSASAAEMPEQKPAPNNNKSIYDQDTVVSPRLRQLAQTPSQPLRPPPDVAAKPSGTGQLARLSSSRLYMLIGVVGVLILLALILVGVTLVRNGPALLAGLTATKTPTPTATLAATPTSALPPTATHVPPTPTVPPTPIPPTATPRPAPTALAKDVLARVTPPEGIKLKVRDKASPTGAILGELDKDTQVTILEGPTDASGITWWKVDNGKGLVGWSAEGLGTVKYLVPIGWAK